MSEKRYNIDMMGQQRYPTDLTDEEWAVLEPLIPPPRPGGRPRSTDMREVLNAIFYVLRGGIPWRMLPHDFPPWKTVYHYFRTWRINGIWEAMNEALREKLRLQAGRNFTPSASILDSQSAKTTERGDLVATMGARS
jgi:putative transposase